MTVTLADKAHSIVDEAFADIDFALFPDPPARWWTTTISENHSGKKFHASAYCRKLAKVKTTVETTRPVSEVGSRACYECREGYSTSAVAGDATYRAHQLLARLRAASTELETNPAKVLDSLEADVRAAAKHGGHAEVPRAALAACNQMRLLATQDPNAGDIAALELIAAARLVARPGGSRADTSAPKVDGQPYCDRSLKLLGGSGKPGQATAPTLSRAFQKFLAALDEGQGLAAASEAATAEALPLRDPYTVDQLPSTIALPGAATEVSLADVIDHWRTQATSLATSVIKSWTHLIEATMAEYRDLGDLCVEIRVNTLGAAQYGNRRALETELARFTAVFPSRVDHDETRYLTVPALVAAWLVKAAGHYKTQARLLPAGDNTAEVVTALEKLREAGNGTLPLSAALVAARGVVHAPGRHAAA